MTAPSPELVSGLGYVAIVVGTFFEGEVVMLAAGAAASAGLLSLPLVVAAGMTGVFASDTLCFAIGRLLRSRVERWFPKTHAKLGGVFRLIERHGAKLIIFFQFFPGLCTVTPVAFGLTRISWTKFMGLDFLGNALWTLVFTFAGFGFGRVFKALSPDWRWSEAVFYSVAAIACGALIYWRAKRGGRAVRNRATQTS